MLDASLAVAAKALDVGRRAEWTTDLTTYRSLPVFTFCEFDEEPGELELPRCSSVA